MTKLILLNYCLHIVYSIDHVPPSVLGIHCKLFSLREADLLLKGLITAKNDADWLQKKELFITFLKIHLNPQGCASLHNLIHYTERTK